MSISGMKLGLPDDIEADVGGIRGKCESLDRLCSTMLGRTHDAEGNFNDAAAHFTDAVAWDIQGATTQEVAKWEEAGAALTNGAATLQLWADDIETYRDTREDLAERWENEKSDAQSRVDYPLHVALGGAAAHIYDAVSDGKSKRETEEIAKLEGIRQGLLTEHDTAWDLLMDRAEETEKDLKDGPSPETYQRMLDAGHLSWRHLGIFVPEEGPPLTEEQGEEAAEKVEEYLDDPEGYEGDIGEVLAMLAVVTGAGAQAQRHGGQPDIGNMDFLESFYAKLDERPGEYNSARGFLGVVEQIEGFEGEGSEVAGGLLQSLGDGILVLSDESLFGGYDKLPESVRLAAEGTMLNAEDGPLYTIDHWASDASALGSLLKRSSGEVGGGDDFSASLALSLGTMSNVSGIDIESLIGEEASQAYLDVAGRNKDAMHDIWTGAYEHPNVLDENGEFRSTGDIETNQGLINDAFEGLYTHDWSDGGGALSSLTDWISEDSSSDNPADRERAASAFYGVVDTFTSDYMMSSASATGGEVEGEYTYVDKNGNEVKEKFDWQDVSMGVLNPEVASSMAGMFEEYIDVFADSEVVDGDNDRIDPSFESEYSGGTNVNLALSDRKDFLSLFVGDEDAAERVLSASNKYTESVFEEYMGTHDGIPDTELAMSGGILWNSVEGAIDDEVSRRVANHEASLDSKEKQAGFAVDLAATFVPNGQTAEVFKFGAKEIVANVLDDKHFSEEELAETFDQSEGITPAEVQVQAMKGLLGVEGISPPPPNMLEGGEFVFDDGAPGYSGNIEARGDRSTYWREDLRHDSWPNGGDNKVKDVVSDFGEAFNQAHGL